MKSEKQYGRFGDFRLQYHKGRKGFPHKVFSHIFSKLPDHPRILDVGCGTGIATAQLYEHLGWVVGADIDARMIEHAEENNPYGLDYFVAPAERLPFENEAFDAVTAFSAFHWFVTAEALREIRRVLKPGGMFFAVNKNEAGDFKKGYKEILKQFIDKKLPDAKKNYNPMLILKENSFDFVEEYTVSVSEFFSLEEAIDYIQSVSLWNLVHDSKKEEALEAVQKYLNEIADSNGRMERKLNVSVVSGKK